jgi:rod shape-determining protein MreC
VTSATLRTENQKLTARNLQLSTQANQVANLTAENAHLRALLDLSQKMTTQSVPAEIQYDTADPFTQKVVIGGGSYQNIQNGSPVVSEDGVVGQVTRVYPMQSEVTLLTDKDQAVPVQIVRTGLRSVIYGMAKGDALEMRFVPISADVMAGDELVTSGLDGVYPPGLPVAKVVRVDKQADTAFARVVCQPVATVRGAKQFLVLHYQSNVPPRPAEPEPASGAAAKDAKGKKTMKAADKDKDKDKDKAGSDKSAAKPASDAAADKSAAKTPEKGAAAKPADKPAANATSKTDGKSAAASKTADKPDGKNAKAPAASKPAAASGANR